MQTPSAKDATVQKGSAMIISVLVTAIMSLLGISYLLMADTENRIAENEKLSAQALYFGEGVIREVKRWFDRPPYGVSGDKNLVKPLIAIVDHMQRQIDIDGDGPTVPVAADGSGLNPYYKVGVDRNADGIDDIFDKPYRFALADMLVGTEAGPDMKIDRATGGATATFLDGLGDKIAPNFPAAAAGLRARVKTIDIYAPPYLNIGGTWTRYGMATVKATVEIIRTGAGAQIVATKIVKAVLNETPYPGPYGPLQSCEELTMTGEFTPHWGTSTSVGDLSISTGGDNKIPLSIPREVPPSPKVDRLHGWNDSAMWDGMYKGAGGTMVGKSIDDPWYRVIVDGMAWKAGAGTPMWTPAATPQQPYAPGTTDQDMSNKLQLYGGVGCPEFEYQTWKDIARSGGSDVHYYAWNNGAAFQENGSGPTLDFKALMDGKTGLFFFDTMDRLAPHNPDANGVAVNLTPDMQVTAGFGVRGFVYANTVIWTAQGTPGRPVTMHWPGEPYRDANENGAYDPGEDFVNLNYATISTTDPKVKPVVSRADAGGDGYGGAVMYNSRGPDITGQNAIVWGLLYVSGNFDSQGTQVYYGSVVTKAGMNNSLAGTTDLYWDTDLKDNWPPPGWELPRVIITRWQTDL